MRGGGFAESALRLGFGGDLCVCTATRWTGAGSLMIMWEAICDLGRCRYHDDMRRYLSKVRAGENLCSALGTEFSLG